MSVRKNTDSKSVIAFIIKKKQQENVKTKIQQQNEGGKKKPNLILECVLHISVYIGVVHSYIVCVNSQAARERG